MFAVWTTWLLAILAHISVAYQLCNVNFLPTYPKTQKSLTLSHLQLDHLLISSGKTVPADLGPSRFNPVRPKTAQLPRETKPAVFYCFLGDAVAPRASAASRDRATPAAGVTGRSERGTGRGGSGQPRASIPGRSCRGWCAVWPKWPSRRGLMGD